MRRYALHDDHWEWIRGTHPLRPLGQAARL